jgi:hypothetical protein
VSAAGPRERDPVAPQPSYGLIQDSQLRSLISARVISAVGIAGIPYDLTGLGPPTGYWHQALASQRDRG